MSLSTSEFLDIILRNVRLIDETKLDSTLDEYRGYLSSLGNYFEVDGGLVRLSDGKDMYVFGDLHGDLLSLYLFLRKIDVYAYLKEGGMLVFLGDYIDRGEYQVETILFLILLQMQFKKQVVLLRGNHEPPEWLLPYPHDFPRHLMSRYPAKWRYFYRKFLEIFQLMPHALYTTNGLFLAHGGISVKELNLESYRRPTEEVLTEILWNDPYDGYGIYPSYRGVGYLWGEDITIKFLSKNGLKLIVRGHEPCEGYMWKHGRTVLTLFSRLGGPYYNSRASIVRLPLTEFKYPREQDFVNLTPEELSLT